MSRAVLHVDMDAFYASVEERDDPALAGKPVIVGWDGGRGVVAAANYEVRKFGVHSAMPMRTALRLCPHALCVRPRMQRYQEVSRQVFGVFQEFTPLVQGLSLDEAFLDVTAQPAALGRCARDRAAREAPHPRAHRPHRLGRRRPQQAGRQDRLRSRETRRSGGGECAERVRAVLDPLSVRKLPGLGRKTGEKVEAAGIRTLGELRSAPDAVLWPLFGRYSAWMRERASGIDERPVQPDLEEKSISAEDTFATDIAEVRSLQHQLARLADLAATRLRARGLMAGCVGVKIRRDDFTTFTRQRAVAPPTCEGRAVAGVSAELLARWLAANPGAKLRLLGVVLTELTPASQLGLFEEARPQSRLDAALDEARARFGSRALRRGNTIE